LDFLSHFAAVGPKTAPLLFSLSPFFAGPVEIDLLFLSLFDEVFVTFLRRFSPSRWYWTCVRSRPPITVPFAALCSLGISRSPRRPRTTVTDFFHPRYYGTGGIGVGVLGFPVFFGQPDRPRLLERPLRCSLFSLCFSLGLLRKASFLGV